jgi:hypothetical protein
MIKKKVLKGDLILIRATYQFLIQNYVNRPYIPGLFRLLIHSLAVRNEWELLLHLCRQAIYHTQPFMSNRNVAALVNYAISLSIKFNKGQSQVNQCTPSSNKG